MVLTKMFLNVCWAFLYPQASPRQPYRARSGICASSQRMLSASPRQFATEQWLLSSASPVAGYSLLVQEGNITLLEGEPIYLTM